MAYGCGASLQHAVARLEGVSGRIQRLTAADVDRGATTDEQMLVHELAIAVAYLADAVRYLKDGVP
jgi:hypothetical protein